MKNLSTPEFYKLILAFASLLLTTFSYGAKYTATTSGNFSSTSTWLGGIVPPANVSSDTIIISPGITVTLDNHLTLNGSAALLSVAGTLKSNTNTSLTLSTNSLAGTGSMMISNLIINTGAGNLANIPANVTINGSLQLNSGILKIHHTNLVINGTVSGSGQLSGNIASNLTVNTTGGLSTGLQFAPGGQVVNNFTLSVGSGNSVTVASDLTINGTLILNGGSKLNISGKTLTLNVNSHLEGTGSLISNTTSNLLIHSTSGIPSLILAGTINNLTINSGFNGVVLGGNASINGLLHLKSGSLLTNGHDIILNGDVLTTGNGALSPTAATDITINNVAGTSGVLNFGGTGQVNTLTVNVGAAAEAKISGNLMVNGTLQLTTGTLSIHNTNLSINGQVSGPGKLSSNGSTTLAINSTGGLTTPLNFVTGGQLLKSMRVSVGEGHIVTLASDIHVINNLHFASGKLDIGSNTLGVDLTGTITGASKSSYVITSEGGLFEKEIAPGTSGAVNFPIGTSNNYSPAVVSLAPASSGGYVQVGVMEEVKERGTEGEMLGSKPLVNATWHVHSNITNNLDLTLKVMWPEELEINGFNRNDAFVSHFTDDVWDEIAGAAATAETHGMFGLQRTGIKSLSPFSVFSGSTITAVGDINTVSNFNVYPNPAIDNIMIEATASEPLNMVIYNSNGQLMGHYKLSDASATVSVKDFSNGNYFVKVFNNQGNSLKQFTKI